MSYIEWKKEEKCCNKVESLAKHGLAADGGCSLSWVNPKLLLLQGNLGITDAKELNSTRKAFSLSTSFLL